MNKRTQNTNSILDGLHLLEGIKNDEESIYLSLSKKNREIYDEISDELPMIDRSCFDNSKDWNEYKKANAKFMDGDISQFKTIVDFYNKISGSNYKAVKESLECLDEGTRITKYPDEIFIVIHENTKIGYVYHKDYEVEGGGCYYSSKENSNVVIGSFIRLYPDGHLTYLWNGKESDLKNEWFYIGK